MDTAKSIFDLLLQVAALGGAIFAIWRTFKITPTEKTTADATTVSKYAEAATQTANQYIAVMKRVDDLETRNTALEERNTTLEKTVKDQGETILSLQETLIAKTKEILTLRQTVYDWGNGIEALTQQVIKARLTPDWKLPPKGA